jgi:hypothetical protein
MQISRTRPYKNLKKVGPGDEASNSVVLNMLAVSWTTRLPGAPFAVALVSYSARQGLQLDLPVVLLPDTSMYLVFLLIGGPFWENEP